MGTVESIGRLGVRRALPKRRSGPGVALLLRGNVSLLGSLKPVVEDVLVGRVGFVGLGVRLRNGHGRVVQLVLVDVRHCPV